MSQKLNMHFENLENTIRPVGIYPEGLPEENRRVLVKSKVTVGNFEIFVTRLITGNEIIKYENKDNDYMKYFFNVVKAKASEQLLEVAVIQVVEEYRA